MRRRVLLTAALAFKRVVGPERLRDADWLARRNLALVVRGSTCSAARAPVPVDLHVPGYTRLLRICLVGPTLWAR